MAVLRGQVDALPARSADCLLATLVVRLHRLCVQVKKHNRSNLAARIYRKLRGVRGLDEAELWQHALFFAMTPQERCHFSLKTARSALSLRRSTFRAR